MRNRRERRALEIHVRSEKNSIFAFILALVLALAASLAACSPPQGKGPETRRAVAEGNEKLQEMQKIQSELRENNIELMERRRLDFDVNIRYIKVMSRSKLVEAKAQLERYLEFGAAVSALAKREDVVISEKTRTDVEKSVESAQAALDAVENALVETKTSDQPAPSTKPAQASQEDLVTPSN